MRSLKVSRTLEAPPDAVLAALHERGSVTPGAAGSGHAWSEPTAVLDELAIDAAVEPAEGGSTLHLTARWEVHVPYFQWLFGPLIRRSVRNHLEQIAEGPDGGSAAPPRRPLWAPPERLDQRQIAAIATASFVLALTGYGASLLTQTIHFVAQAYEATDAQLGIVTAVTRVGTLAALAGAILADRIGRKRIIVGATGFISVATFLSGLAPDLVPFAVLQVLIRGAAQLAGVVAFIVVVEEAPERARAFMLALAGIASSLGFALGAILLPIADLAPEAWRVLFLVGGLGVVFLPGISRRLTETRRFTELASSGFPAGHAGGRERRRFGGRFVLVAFVGLMLNVFFAPSSQFTNRYLGDERGFSGFDILVLRAVTQTVTAVAAVWAGGRMAEAQGRKPAATIGVFCLALFGITFFTLDGIALWFGLLLSTAGGAFASPSLSAFNTELFPTQVRGTAGGALLVAAVAGSVIGLLVAGALSDPLDSIGRAVAVTAVGPIFVGLILIRRLPEARGLDLDEVSPPRDG